MIQNYKFSIEAVIIRVILATSLRLAIRLVSPYFDFEQDRILCAKRIPGLNEGQILYTPSARPTIYTL